MKIVRDRVRNREREIEREQDQEREREREKGSNFSEYSNRPLIDRQTDRGYQLPFITTW